MPPPHTPPGLINQIRNARANLMARNPTYEDAEQHPEEQWVEYWADGECLTIELYVNGQLNNDPVGHVNSRPDAPSGPPGNGNGPPAFVTTGPR